MNASRLTKKMPVALRKAEGLTCIPYKVRGNEWRPAPMGGISWCMMSVIVSAPSHHQQFQM